MSKEAYYGPINSPSVIKIIYCPNTNYCIDVDHIGWNFKSVDDTTTIEATSFRSPNRKPSILIPNHKPLVNTYYIITIGSEAWKIRYVHDKVIQESANSVDGKRGIAIRKEGENTTYHIDNRTQICTISYVYVTSMQTGIPKSEDEEPITTKNLTPGEEISRFPIRKSAVGAPKNAAIFVLPNDILDCIFDYLPKSSVVAYTLTSLKLKNSLGPEHWTKIVDVVKNSPKETTDLLDLLCKDYEQCIPCHTCLKLHEPSASTIARKCWEHDKKFGVESYIHAQFRFSEMQMAAKLYNEGKYESSQLQLRSIGRTGDQLINYHRHQPNDPCITHEFRMNSQARIIYRSQHVYLLPHSLLDFLNVSIYPGCFISLLHDHHRTYDGEQWLDPIFICGHMGPLCGRRNWAELVSRGMQWECPICGTEFHANLVGYGDEGLAIVATKWMDLGRGLNQGQEWERNFVLQEIPPEDSTILTMGFNGPISMWWEDVDGESRYVPTLSKAEKKVLGTPIRRGTRKHGSWITGYFSVEWFKNWLKSLKGK
ncbi:uncharacterized protein EAE98_002047 [Botrytis deweyae]|uniref:F-box domain-containing protein n=1 Tax=Botrytis deweyae TaxID=2478750 RepID=A0ABQ7IW22_9HELO|nr:uncharacterized protein EAE98_002047 [Botrytis deweyae]KAF7935827.1 hypothetical protein EAE98_002047 [Botrytis deweyae]